MREVLTAESTVESKRNQQPFFVIIEGVAAVGKSELAKELKQRIHDSTNMTCLHFDTGEMFRSIAWSLQKTGVVLSAFITKDEDEITKALNLLSLKIEVKKEKEQFPKTYFYNAGEIIPEAVLYASEIDGLSSEIAGNKAIQKWAYTKRLDTILSSGVDVAIINGRDTVANGGFDEVDGLRIVLQASDENRVLRRQDGKRAIGEDLSYELVRDALFVRDERDMESGVIAFGGNWTIDRTGLTDSELGDLVFRTLRIKRNDGEERIEESNLTVQGLVAISLLGLNNIENDPVFQNAIKNDRQIRQALFPLSQGEKQLVTVVDH